MNDPTTLYTIAAIAVPILVFLISVVMASKGKISYGILVTLLLFGLGAGFTMANYEILRRVVQPESTITQKEAKLLRQYLEQQFGDLNKEIKEIKQLQVRLESKPELKLKSRSTSQHQEQKGFVLTEQEATQVGHHELPVEEEMGSEE